MTETVFTIADYPVIRQTIFDLHIRILKNPSFDEIKTCAKQLGLWRHKQLSFNYDAETDLLMDYRMYGFQPHGFNMAEKYRRINQSRLTDFEQALLNRMSRARYVVFQVQESNRLETMTVVDVFSKTHFTLVDQQLAKTAAIGKVIAAFVIDFGEFFIQTGAALPLKKEILHADEVIEVLEQMGDADDILLDLVNTPKFARAIISASIRLGHTGDVNYQSI